MPDLSVLIATYNRADVLRQTLEAMCVVDREGLVVEFVVIDNNSKDSTGEVIDSFKDRLPIRHLFQPRQGKSAALNLALDTVELGDIVVFTDDDVQPDENWLQVIAKSIESWPEHYVFGGEVHGQLPEGTMIPSWATPDDIDIFFGARKDLGNSAEYPGSDSPTGANFWIRRQVVIQGARFDELLGSGEIARVGEDISFIEALRGDGFPPVFVSRAKIGHLVQAEQLTKKEMRSRSFKRGRYTAYRSALRDDFRTEIAERCSLLVRLLSLILRANIAYALSFPLPTQRLFKASMQAWWNYGYRMELLQIRFRLSSAQHKTGPIKSNKGRTR